MKDIITDPNDNNDLLIRGGDFVISDSGVQHIQHILEADSGQYKQHPRIGVGIRRALNGQVDGEVRRLIQLQLESDGLEVSSISYDAATGSLKIRT